MVTKNAEKQDIDVDRLQFLGTLRRAITELRIEVESKKPVRRSMIASIAIIDDYLREELKEFFPAIRGTSRTKKRKIVKS